MEESVVCGPQVCTLGQSKFGMFVLSISGHFRLERRLTKTPLKKDHDTQAYPNSNKPELDM